MQPQNKEHLFLENRRIWNSAPSGAPSGASSGSDENSREDMPPLPASNEDKHKSPGYLGRQFRNIPETIQQTAEGALYAGYGIAQPFLGMAGYSVNNVKQAWEDVKLVGGTSWEWAKYVGRETRELTFGTVGRVVGETRDRLQTLFTEKTGILSFLPKKAWQAALVAASPVIGLAKQAKNYMTGDKKAANDDFYHQNIAERFYTSFSLGVSNIYNGTRDSLNQLFVKGPYRDLLLPTISGAQNVGIGVAKVGGVIAGDVRGAIPFVGEDYGPYNFNISPKRDLPAGAFDSPPLNDPIFDSSPDADYMPRAA
ncbi:hypothetical protein IPN35_02375 [Candidatus Peregrinibacteria bacterium]|nr:MAG: hypothetical protein IPN35_02375 [Candidatus Peregrinibacteria bacterium]